MSGNHKAGMCLVMGVFFGLWQRDAGAGIFAVLLLIMVWTISDEWRADYNSPHHSRERSDARSGG